MQNAERKTSNFISQNKYEPPAKSGISIPGIKGKPSYKVVNGNTLIAIPAAVAKQITNKDAIAFKFRPSK